MRTSGPQPINGTAIAAVDRSSEEFLRAQFGDRFDAMIAKPIIAIQRVMRSNNFSIREAADYLSQVALDREIGYAAAAVMWLDAARTELEKGTLVHV